MHVVVVAGWLLVLVGVAVAGLGAALALRHRTLSRVPFRRPSELVQRGAAAADAQGMVATEGALQVSAPLLSPVSGEACLFYELALERRWEKIVVTVKGEEKQKGAETTVLERRGSFFQLTDGAGSVLVDATSRFEAKLERGQTHAVAVNLPLPESLRFGKLDLPTPRDPRLDPFTTEFVVTERLVRHAPALHVLGQYVHGARGLAVSAPVASPDAKLIVTRGSRTGVLTRSLARIGAVTAGGLVLVVGGVLVVVRAPRTGLAPCPSAFKGESLCEDRIAGGAGVRYAWTVESAGSYEVKVTQTHARSSVYALLRVEDAGGVEVASASGAASGELVTLRHAFAPGTYALLVSDREKLELKTGVPFTLSVRAAPPDEAQGALDGGGEEGARDAAALDAERTTTPHAAPHPAKGPRVPHAAPKRR